MIEGRMEGVHTIKRRCLASGFLSIIYDVWTHPITSKGYNAFRACFTTRNYLQIILIGIQKDFITDTNFYFILNQLIDNK